MARCTTCKKRIVGPKLIIEGQWKCSTCMYYLDKGLIPPGTERDR